MTDREGGVTLLGYICMAVLINFNIAGIRATACFERTSLDNLVHVKAMCVSATLRNTRVVIDSWDTGGPDVYSCTCTVTLDTRSVPSTSTTTLVALEYPEISPSQNCGSVLTINSTKSNSYTETRCTRVPSTSTYNFGTSDMLTLTLSRANVTRPWTSGHCILISQPQGADNLDLTVTCKDPKGKYLPLSSTTPTIPITTESATTTTPIISTTTKSMRTSTSSSEKTVNTASNETTSSDTKSTPTTTRECPLECHPKQGYPLSAVLVPLVVSILMVSVGTAANVVLYKRRFALIKQPGNTDPNMTSPNMNNYDSLDLSRVEPPNVYADTTTGHMYVNTTTGS